MITCNKLPCQSFLGCKLRLCKDIATQLCGLLDANGAIRTYYEPCGGMLSVMCAMIDSNVNIDKYVVSDIDKHVVALWLHVKDNGLEGLPDVDAYTQGEYGECKKLADDSDSTASALVAYYGFAGTRDGIRFNAWHRNKAERHAKVRRFRVGLLHLQKYLQHDKVNIFRRLWFK